MGYQKDYSEYELTPYDKYRMQRKRRKDIILNYFHNKVRFDPENRIICVFMDDEHEDYSMDDMIADYHEDLEKRTGVHINNDPLDEEARKEEVIMARLKDEYASRIVPELEKKLGTTNRMLVPRLQKIVINMGFGIVSKD